MHLTNQPQHLVHSACKCRLLWANRRKIGGALELAHMRTEFMCPDAQYHGQEQVPNGEGPWMLL